MISYLIDASLMGALAFTSWRTGRMYMELRHLRSAGSSFQQMLKESDACINRAAHAVVMLKSEGVKTLRALEQRTIEARELAGRLEDAMLDAELRAAMVSELATIPSADDLDRPSDRFAAIESLVANDISSEVRSEDDDFSPRDNWLSRIESRLASASAANH